jgi:hypothetical protein
VAAEATGVVPAELLREDAVVESAVVGGVAAVGAGMGPDLGLSGPWPLLALAGISIVAMNNVQCAKYN